MENAKDAIVPHDERLTWLLWNAYHTVEKGFREQMGATKFRHLFILHPLAEFGALTHSELAERLRVKKSAMSKLATEIVRGGWAIRTLSKDKRYKCLELTESGKKYVAEMTKSFLKAQETFKKKFTENEWNKGLRFLWYLQSMVISGNYFFPQ